MPVSCLQYPPSLKIPTRSKARARQFNPDFLDTSYIPDDPVVLLVRLLIFMPTLICLGQLEAEQRK